MPPKTNFTYRALFAFILIWLLTTLYTVVFPTRHLTQDAISSLQSIETQNIFDLWHTQHLFGLFPGYLVYQLSGGSLHAWQAVRIAHAFLAGGTVALLFSTLVVLTQRRILAIVCGMMLWFSYGFWHFQSDPDIYSLGTFSVALLLFTFANFLTRQTGKYSVWSMLWLGVVASFSILSHQMNIELVGLIGFGLIWLAWRAPKTERIRAWQDVFIFGIIPLVSVPVVYFIGWQSVNRYLSATSQPELPFVNWALRYFVMARDVNVTWGKSLSLSSLPTAAYGILSSWTLPPLLRGITPLQGLFLGATVIGGLLLTAILGMNIPRLNGSRRLFALICIAAIALNSFSAWWWQAGNIKFALFLQIPFLILVGLLIDNLAWMRTTMRRLSIASVGLAAFGLIGAHLLFTLPYETRGGLFTIDELTETTGKSIWIEDNIYANGYAAISGAPRQTLPPDFCSLGGSQRTHPALQNAVWVVNERTAIVCDALKNATLVGQFQTDRTRDQWRVYALGSNP